MHSYYLSMNESRKTPKPAHDFELELENRLNQLSSRRSTKKLPKPDIKIQHPHYYEESE